MMKIRLLATEERHERNQGKRGRKAEWRGGKMEQKNGKRGGDHAKQVSSRGLPRRG